MILETIKISSVNIEDRKALGIRAGDTVRVWIKIEEKGKTRTQAFEGLVLARKHGNEAGATFTVRKVASGVGVERIFPLFSPMIDKIEIVKRSRVRRSKLYFIREKVAREIRRQMRKMKMVTLSTKSEKEEAEEKMKEEEEKAKIESEETKEGVVEEVEATETPTEEVSDKVEEVVEEIKEDIDETDEKKEEK